MRLSVSFLQLAKEPYERLQKDCSNCTNWKGSMCLCKLPICECVLQQRLENFKMSERFKTVSFYHLFGSCRPIHKTTFRMNFLMRRSHCVMDISWRNCSDCISYSYFHKHGYWIASQPQIRLLLFFIWRVFLLILALDFLYHIREIISY